MARYIDADKIISHLNDEIEACGDVDINFYPINYGTYLGLKSSKAFIETAETTDVVQVVRCKDCKHFYNGNFKACRHWNYHSVTETDFCSCGKRKEKRRWQCATMKI